MALAIAERRYLRLFVLCALYLAQGIPFGFVTVTLAAYLAGRGATTGEVGNLTALVSLPWAFKWAWGPVIDRFSRSRMGRRRPWILAAQASMVLGAIALIAVPELRHDLELLGWIVLAINVCASLQDVSVDALAVDLLPESERGTANGLMYGCSYLGVIGGGAGLSTVLGLWGLRAALLVQVFALTAIMMVPLLLRERRGDALLSLETRPPVAASGQGSMLGLLRNLWRAFSRRSPIVAVFLAVLIQLGAGAIPAIGTVLLMHRLGWSQADYGQMIGGLPLIFGLAGSVGGGFLADWLGHRRTVALSSILLGAAWIGFAAAEPWWPIKSFIVAASCADQLLLGTLSASLFTLFMDVSWPRVAATQFTAYMALLNLSRTFGAKLAGVVDTDFGTAGAYIAFGALQIAVVLLLIFLDPTQNRRELGE